MVVRRRSSVPHLSFLRLRACFYGDLSVRFNTAETASSVNSIAHLSLDCVCSFWSESLFPDAAAIAHPPMCVVQDSGSGPAPVLSVDGSLVWSGLVWSGLVRDYPPSYFSIMTGAPITDAFERWETWRPRLPSIQDRRCILTPCTFRPCFPSQP